MYQHGKLPMDNANWQETLCCCAGGIIFAFLLHRLDRDFFRQYFRKKLFFPVCALITNIWENVGIFVSDIARIYSRIWLYLWALDHKLDLTALSRDALFDHGGSFYNGSFTRCGVKQSGKRKKKKFSRKRTKLISTIVKEDIHDRNKRCNRVKSHKSSLDCCTAAYKSEATNHQVYSDSQTQTKMY